ncbi:MAG: GDP-L-fucose synthase [Rhodospirillales bacterium]|nr:GDP-L-fucose synthase [Rhodospirillales bacterium]MCB9994925.1 GDP-L-fucose synthase [Rhodospirillales bacterium]
MRHKRVFVAGHRGMVGSAVLRRLQDEDCRILTADIDLRDQAQTHDWLAHHKPDGIILAAARVGGIAANSTAPADFLYDNLMIESNVIHGAFQAGVRRLLFLGSSCIYPREAAQPITEEALLSGPLEPTNEWYAVAKIAGIKMCQAYRAQHGCDFIAAMPCNLYGPGDTYDAHRSHVIPALIMKMVQAKAEQAGAITLWGTGKPLREFLYVDDLADALVFLLQHYNGAQQINVGSGTELSIAALAKEIAAVVGYDGEILFDTAQPDGTPRKLMDSTRLYQMGWTPHTPLREGLEKAYAWYLESQDGIKDAA